MLMLTGLAAAMAKEDLSRVCELAVLPLAARGTDLAAALGAALPKAVITPIAGLGSKAFSALQRIKAGGITTDQLTVVVRDRNVLVTVVFEGDSGRGGYHSVPVSQLSAGAVAAARDVLSQLKS